MGECIYRFRWSAQSGFLCGIFVADEEDVKAAVGKSIHLGIITERPLNIYGILAPGDIRLVTDDPVAVDVFKKHGMATGYNPLHYLPEEGKMTGSKIKQSTGCFGGKILHTVEIDGVYGDGDFRIEQENNSKSLEFIYSDVDGFDHDMCNLSVEETKHLIAILQGFVDGGKLEGPK